MAYRDDLTALQARHDALVAETSRLQRDLDQTVAKLPVLPSIRVASPCTEAWSDMGGDDRIRACAKCNQFVYNLSEMTRDEAELLISTRDGRLCVRFFQRPDGTILLADCSVRRTRIRNRRVAAAGLVAALAGGAAYTAHSRSSHHASETRTVMGAVASDLPAELDPDSLGRSH